MEVSRGRFAFSSIHAPVGEEPKTVRGEEMHFDWQSVVALIGLGAVIVGGLVYLAVRTSLEKWIAARFDLYRERELETLKAEFSKTLEGLKHQYHLEQAVLSLAFEHQRSAYSEILGVLVEAKRAFDARYDWEDRTYGPFKENPWPKVFDVRLKHLLFLDEDILDALEFSLKAISMSLPWSDGLNEHEPGDERVEEARRRFEFLLQQTARLLRTKAGLVKDEQALLPLAVYGALDLVNRPFYPRSGFPTTGIFQENRDVSFDEKMNNGIEHRYELAAEVERLIQVLLKFRGGGIFVESLGQARRYNKELLKGNR